MKLWGVGQLRQQLLFYTSSFLFLPWPATCVAPLPDPPAPPTATRHLARPLYVKNRKLAASQAFCVPGGLRPSELPPSISSNMSTVGHGTFSLVTLKTQGLGSVYYFRNRQIKDVECILFSELQTQGHEVHTTCGAESSPPWKCILFFGTENSLPWIWGSWKCILCPELETQ